jgi:hypothetical protein
MDKKREGKAQNKNTHGHGQFPIEVGKNRSIPCISGLQFGAHYWRLKYNKL